MLKHIISLYRLKFQMWIRQRTRPMSVEEAEAKQFFWARMYALTGLLFLGFTTYNVFQRQSNKTNDISEMVRHLNSDQPVRVFRYKGFNKVSDVTYSAGELDSLLKKPTDESSDVGDPENSVTDNSF